EADLLLGATPLGDVLRRALEPQRLPVFAGDELRLAVDNAFAAVREHHAKVGDEGAARAPGIQDAPDQRIAVVPVDSRQERLRIEGLVRFLETVERAQLLGAEDLARREIVFEAADPRAALRVVEMRAAARQLLEVRRHLRP